jgi:hypothetical protein
VGRRVAKAVAFWTALAATLVVTAAFTLTTDQWCMFKGSGPQVAIGHGVLTVIVQWPSNTVDKQPFDYYTPTPVWFAPPAINRGVGNAVVVVPLVLPIGCLIVAAWCLWPFQTRRTFSARAWRAVALCGGWLCALSAAGFWATGIQGHGIYLRAFGDHPVSIDRGAIAVGTEEFPGLSSAINWYPSQTVRFQVGVTGLAPKPTAPPPVWLPQSVPTSAGTAMLFPLWMPFIALTGLTWLAWRRAWQGCGSGCRSCGYNMAGLASNARCPECGTSPRAPGTPPPP